MNYISGFTIVRNARVLDYPFRESVESILPIVDEFVINCGKSDDDTHDICLEIQAAHPDKIKIINTVWSREDQTGGYQLKAQTDAAIEQCQGKWCFYVQADEAVSEADYPKLLAAIARADEDPKVDGVLFDYLHFYGSYDYTIKGRNWYRREVRLFKNGRGIQSYRDAQGFRRKDGSKVVAVPSAARIFHYGYVRTPDSLRAKSTEMTQWWGQKPPTDPQAYDLVRHVGLRKFLGKHPRTMLNRISQPSSFDPKLCRRKWDGNEIKNALTLVWESLFDYRIGEFRNYTLKR